VHLLLVAVTISIKGGGGGRGREERRIYPKTDRKKRNKMGQMGWGEGWREERVSRNQEGRPGWGNKLKKGTS